jgi:hypothetical protein
MHKPRTCWLKTWCPTGLTAAAVLIAMLSCGGLRAGGENAATAPTTAPAAEKDKDYSGKYLAEGVGNAGRKYKAMVEIIREGDVYQVIWVLGPREFYMGVGLVEDERLSVGWSTGGTPGVVVYKSEGEQLVGRWTAPGSGGKTFKETLTPVK